MSRILAALICTCFITGLTSYVSHPVTLTGAAVIGTAFSLICILSPGGRIYPGFLVASVIMLFICLLSAEHHISSTTTTIHICSSYIAIAGLSGANPQFRGFIRMTAVMSFTVLTLWVWAQTVRAGSIGSWNVTGAAAAGNLMAAQINITLPFLILILMDARGMQRAATAGLILAGMAAVIFVGSRNGIGTLGIIIVLVLFRRHARTAIIAATLLLIVAAFGDELIRIPFIHDFLTRFRFLNYESKAPRNLIWEICFQHLQKSPFIGIGPGHSAKILAFMGINHAHNTVVQVATESGIIAAVIIILVKGALLNLPMKMFLTDKRGFILSLSVVAYMCNSMTDVPLHHPQHTLLLTLCVCAIRTFSPATEPAVSRDGQTGFLPVAANALTGREHSPIPI